MELDATEQHAKLWMKIEDIHLTEADKFLLTEGGQLNDRHVNAAQRLLRAHHPNLKGLSLTMVAGRQKLPSNGLQAFYVRGNQWIVLSTIDCRPAKVNVMTPCMTTKMQIPCLQFHSHWRLLSTYHS